jgi:hypothetical protein
MEHKPFPERAPDATRAEENPQLPPSITDPGPAARPLPSRAPSGQEEGRAPDVFVFNPFAEAYIAHGRAFAPVKHQTMLAEDLANLPQFLCQPGDVVLLAKRPSAGFLERLEQAGFPLPEFVEVRDGGIDLADSLRERKLRGLRPWAWGPDSVEVLGPLFAQVVGEARSANQCFNDNITRLYSKVWSADFLRRVLTECRGWQERPEEQSRPATKLVAPWLCSEQEAGVAVDTLEHALEAIAAIRRRGHHPVVVKETHGLAAHNAIRLWEPEILPEQRRWLAQAFEHSRQLVVEPWLQRQLDFSAQLEMGPSGLKLCGYTGLVNDRKGQFLANWAEPNYSRCLPEKVSSSFPAPAEVSGQLQHFYFEVFSLLEAELQRVGFLGPISIDAFVYRTPEGVCRLKPVVEINPRYTMGRLTLELMKHAHPGTRGWLRLVSRAQARAAGFADLSSYACSLGERLGLRLERSPQPRIREGVICLNDPARAQACLATFEVRPAPNPPGSFSDLEHPRCH